MLGDVLGISLAGFDPLVGCRMLGFGCGVVVLVWLLLVVGVVMGV
jgi:hypothetical protein